MRERGVNERLIERIKEIFVETRIKGENRRAKERFSGQARGLGKAVL